MQPHRTLYIVSSIGVVLLLALLCALVFFQATGDPAQQQAEVASEGRPDAMPRAGWLSQEGDGYSFAYPEGIGTRYISADEWPPTVSVVRNGGPYACDAQAERPNEAGVVREATINGVPYCVIESSEGAAGSVYIEYGYMTPRGADLVTVSFTLRMTQCGNYDEPEMQACTAEREGFSADALAAEIAESVEIE